MRRRRMLADLEKKYPGNRQNSLYASVELSLRRLPPEMREQVKVLAPFHGGVHINILAYMLLEDPDTTDEAAVDSAFTSASALASALIEVGLAQAMDYSHLRLDPALPAYLWAQLSQDEQEQMQTRWAEGMTQLVNFLYEQQFQDAQLAAQLTLLELPNLLTLLDWLQDQASPEQVVDLATRVEQLLANLGQLQALARVVHLRERAAQPLGGWSQARFEAERFTIERLLDTGNLPAAYTAAQDLLQRGLAAGEGAYPVAAYDIALAHMLLGRVLNSGGQAEATLAPLAEAQRRFETLAGAGDTDAARMASAAISERGDCLRLLGRLDEAAAAYEEAIERFEKLDDRRWVAISKGQLGTVRLRQQRYAEALEIYTEARQIFERLGEPGSIATSWHQIGMVHKQSKQFDQAERIYRQSLALSVQHKNRANEALTLRELGNLYNQMDRLEEASTFHGQAIDIFIQLQDRFNEGKEHANLAFTLLKLRRYDDARRELHRAIECLQRFGNAAEPWKAWSILYDLEQATSNPQAAAQARQQAIDAYLAYRRAGGESQNNAAGGFRMVWQAIQQGDTREAEQTLTKYLRPDAEPRAKVVIPKLQAILAGERNPVLADDPDLDYGDAAELRLLLEG
ncbi:MAG: tetratricopeptide repeat protein [Chloroflexi bacterium]|nr:tetratricopeptide repeat protein [Chloroflexota bacterium]